MGQQVRNWFKPLVSAEKFHKYVLLTTPKLAAHTIILKFQSEFLVIENNLLMKVHNDLKVGHLAFPSIKQIFLPLKLIPLNLRIPTCRVHEFLVIFVIQINHCKSVVKQPLELTIIRNKHLS